jgi:hypothetical protein
VDDVTEFHGLLEDTQSELLYRRIDSELSEWRHDIRAELVAEADELYGNLYGTETAYRLRCTVWRISKGPVINVWMFLLMVLTVIGYAVR